MKNLPLGRLAAEFVVIVVGVLVALAADDWGAARQEVAQERRVLTTLLDEFRTNQVRLQDKTDWQSGIDSASQALLQVIADHPGGVSPDSLDHLLADVSWWAGSEELEMSAVDAVVSAGELTLIQNDEIRRALTSWQRLVAVADENEAQDYDWFLTVWMPFMRAQGNLPQVSNAATHQPGSDEPNYGPPVPVAQRVSHLPLLASPEFANVILQRHWINGDILHQFDLLRPEINQMVALLEAELGAQ